MTVDFCNALFFISKNQEINLPVRKASLIQLIRVLKSTWLTVMSNEVKIIYINNYFEMINGDCKNLEKLFYFFSDLIVDAVLIQNEWETVFSHLLFNSRHLLGSLIIAKSISKHFKRHIERDDKLFEQFSSVFFSSIQQTLSSTNISFDVLDITYSTIYLLAYRKIPLFFIENPSFVSNLILNILFFSDNLNCFEQENYQKSLKNVLKAIRQILFLLTKNRNLFNFFLLNEENESMLIFNFALNLFTMNISPPVRDALTRFLLLIFNTFPSVLNSINKNFPQFIESTFLPFFIDNEINDQMYTEISCLCEPRDSAIFLLQSLTSTMNRDFNQIFSAFLNQYLGVTIQNFLNCGNNLANSKLLLSKTNMVSSSLCLNDVSLLQPLLFQSDISDLRISAFTILVNFQSLENEFFPHDLLFNECFLHFNDSSFVVRKLAAISVLRSIENIEKLHNLELLNYLPQIFAAYLSISQDPQSPKLLKKLLELSGDPGYEMANILLSSLVSNLMYIFSDPNGMHTSIDGRLAQKIGKRICDVITLRRIDEAERGSCICQNFDDFILGILSLYENFDDFFKEIILDIFETAAEICCFSPPNVSWLIAKVFCFKDSLFEAEAKVLKNILILSRNQNSFDFELIQFLLERLFAKLGESEDGQDDEEIVLSLIGNFISSFANHEDIQSSIIKQLLPILGQKVAYCTNSNAVSQLISICLLFSNQENIGIIFQDIFLNFWLENASYPFFCSSAVSVFPNILNIGLFEISHIILLKVCDELSDFAKDEITSVMDFPEFEIESIISNFLKLLKYLKENHQMYYIEFYDKASVFLDETLPQIVDNICE